MKHGIVSLFPAKLPKSLVLGVFFLVFLFMYGSVLVVDYGYIEDYSVLLEELYPHAITKRIVEGRPLYALGVKLFQYLSDDIQDLRYARFMGIVGISLLGWSIYYMLVRTGRSAFQSFCAAVIICSSLPIQIYAAWATTSMFPFAAFASGVAVYLADRAFAVDCLDQKYLLVSRGTAALLAAVLIYQPAAMFFWVFAAMTLLVQETPFHDVLRRFAQYFMIWLVAMLLGFAAYKLGAILFPYLPSRGTLAGAEDVSAKIRFLLHYPLPLSLNPIVVQTYGRGLIVSGYVFLAVIMAGIFMYFNGGLKTRICKFSVAAAILILTFTPLLVTSESLSSTRSLPASAGIVLLYAFFAFHGYTRHLRIHDRADIVIGCAAICCAMLAAYQTFSYIVMPQARELTIMQTQLAGSDFSQKKNVHVIRPDWLYTLSPIRMGEHGDTSSRVHYSAEAMARLLQRDMASELGVQLPVTHGTVHDPAPPGSFVVDMDEILGDFWRSRMGFTKKWFAPDGEPVLSGTPIIRSRFDVYLVGNTLLYFRDACTRNDKDERFFLHLVPVYEKDLPDKDKRHGFHNLDFDFDHHGVLHRGRCMAKIRLPSYPLLSLRTGQFIIDQGRIWDEEFRIDADHESGT